MKKLKQEIRTEAQYMNECDGSQPDDTTRFTPAGDTAAPTPNEQEDTGTSTSAKKKKADRSLPTSHIVEPGHGLSYDYAWYHSPLEEPAVYHMSDPAAALIAYAAIKAVNERVQFDLRNMKSMLLERELIEDSEDSGFEDGYASSSDDAVDVFAGAR
ncbi:uncharacterized protein N7500_002093 [Penicillium coprophilum]|uniref:uncharacterized protein n=1 Tax=Penicillium coprophilum TaxID=36646 RepID=UPI002395672F|nr:uncharacterized protein N7500_002093 [Penicillium coprophilum]KAJ5169310.1 hypothetical protein N7500_002093 [Penicillium coprophilum]